MYVFAANRKFGSRIRHFGVISGFEWRNKLRNAFGSKCPVKVKDTRGMA